MGVNGFVEFSGWNTMPEIMVPPGEALEMLRDACRLNEGSEAALAARIRQLIEMGVTSLTRDTSHARHRYGLTELAQLAVAIALMKVRIQPSAAARFASEGWPMFVPFVFAGIGEALPERFARQRTAGDGPYAFIEGNGLAQLGRKSAQAARAGGPLPSIRLSTVPALEGEEAERPDTASYLDATRFMPRIFGLLVARAEATEDIWDSLTRLRQSERKVA